MPFEIRPAVAADVPVILQMIRDLAAYEKLSAEVEADEAKLHYGDGEFVILRPGRYVTCAVSGAHIPLEALRYWSPERQEAYAGPTEALQRWKELNPEG